MVLLHSILNCSSPMQFLTLPGMGLGSGSGEVEPSVGSPKTFDDVKGIDEAKGELKEVVEFLRNPEKFTRLGGKLPKGDF